MSYENIPKNKAETAALVEIISPISAFGDLRTISLTPQFQYSFEYTVTNTELVTDKSTGSGALSQSAAQAIVSSGVVAGSKGVLQSRRHAKYRPGLGGLLRFTSKYISSPNAQHAALVGLADELGAATHFKNGLMVGYVGATFGFHRFVNDTIVTVAQADWDDPLDGTGTSGMTLDPTKINVWEIRYQYLGAGKIDLCVEDDATGNFVVVHSILYANLNSVPSSYMPNYYFQVYSANGTSVSDASLSSSSCAYFIEGLEEIAELHQPQFSSSKVRKTGVTTEIAIFTIRNKATYASKTNFIDLLIEDVTASIEASSANNLGQVRLVRNATLGGVPAYSDISTTDSVVDIDVAGTTVTGGKELFYTPLAGKNDRETLNLIPYKIVLAPGETITIAALSANSATIDASLLWKEMF